MRLRIDKAQDYIVLLGSGRTFLLNCTLHCIALHPSALYYTALYYTALFYTALYYTALFYTALYYTALCCTVLHHNALYTDLEAILIYPDSHDRLLKIPSGSTTMKNTPM